MLPPQMDRGQALKALRLKLNGVPYSMIAHACNKSRGTVRNWFCIGGELKQAYDLSIELASAALLGDREAIQERFLIESAQSIETVAELRDTSEKDDVRLNASKDILDRAGFKPIDKSMIVSATINAEQLDETFDALMAEVNPVSAESNPLATNTHQASSERVPSPSQSSAPAQANEAHSSPQGVGGVSGNTVTVTQPSPPPAPVQQKASYNMPTPKVVQ